jgi:hypothetical protein
MEPPHDHDHQRLQKQLLRVEDGSSTRTTWRRLGSWEAVDKANQLDKDSILSNHKRASEGSVLGHMPSSEASHFYSSSKTPLLLFMTNPQLARAAITIAPALFYPLIEAEFPRIHPLLGNTVNKERVVSSSTLLSLCRRIHIYQRLCRNNVPPLLPREKEERTQCASSSYLKNAVVLQKSVRQYHPLDANTIIPYCS